MSAEPKPPRLQINPAAATYRHAYRWWRNEARTSANPKECIHYALSQLRLAVAMDADPQLFRAKSAQQTDWQRFVEATA